MAPETAELIKLFSPTDQSLVAAMLDAVTSPLVVLDADGRILSFNHACTQLSGFSQTEVVGQKTWTQLFPSEEQETVKYLFTRLQAGQKTIQQPGHWLTKDGRTPQINWQYKKLPETNIIVATGHEITRPEHPPLILDTGESLQRITTAVLHKLTSLDDVLHIVCAEARQLTAAASSAVLLLEENSWLHVAANDGTPAPILERLPLADSLAGLVIDKQRPLLLNGYRDQVKTYYRSPDITTLLAVPLRIDENIIGVLDVINKPGGFSDKDIQIMMLFADQAAIAIENARLYEQAEHLAILEERQRLARELHDSVTQALYSVSLYTDATRLALAAGKQAVAQEHLRELRQMAREAMLDMRLLIFELRPPILEREGLAAALQARLEAVETRSGLQTDFAVEGTCQLPLSIEEELYRIAQEALTNAVKHAQAEQVSLHLSFGNRRYCLTIEDDGLGFDLEAAQQSGGLGLRSMEQRIQRIGANLHISCEPGKGTTLQVQGTLL